MSIESAKDHIERVKPDAGGSSQVGAVEGGAIIVIIFLALCCLGILPVSHSIDEVVEPRSVSHVIDENIEGGP